MNNIEINTKFVTKRLVLQVKTAQKFVDLADYPAGFKNAVGLIPVSVLNALEKAATSL